MSLNKYAQLELVIHSTNNKAIGNSANFKSMAQWNNSVDGNVTDVGSNGTSNPWGIFDMSGQVYEWTDTIDSKNSTNRVLRGGCFMDDQAYSLSKYNRKTFNYKNSIDEGIFGFRVATTGAAYQYNDLVTISGVNNTGDDCGYGSVSYQYKISKYLVTNQEYVEFLNSVNDDSPQARSLYDDRMGSNNTGGIVYVSCNDVTERYVVKENMHNKPVVFITWFNAAKYCNWLTHNKTQDIDKLNTGSYNLSPPNWNNLTEYYVNDLVQFSGHYYKAQVDFLTQCPQGYVPENWFCCPDNIYAAPTSYDCPASSGSYYASFDPISFKEGWIEILIRRSSSGIYFLPNENEWYKAAYYDLNKNDGNEGYWKYATGYDEDPMAVLCNDVGSGITVINDYDSYKVFPISIVTDNAESFASIKPINSGIIPQISLSEINRIGNVQNNLFFINTNISGLQAGSLYNYSFSALDSNWPSNIDPISGSFIAYGSGFDIRSVLKFCPAYKDYTGQDCGYNLDYSLDSLDLNLVKNNIYTVLQIKLDSENYPSIVDKLTISTSIDLVGSPNQSGLPTIKRNECASIKIISPTGTRNSIAVSGYLCADYIPIVTQITQTIPGDIYTLSLSSSDNNVTISPSSIPVAFGLYGSGKAVSTAMLNGVENCIITAKLINESTSYITQDSIVIKCLDLCNR
jgi:hypothetical protein